MFRQNAADNVFAKRNTKDMRDLFCNLPTTQAGIASFHFNDRRNDFRRWPLGTGMAARSRRIQPSMLTPHQSSVKPRKARRLENERTSVGVSVGSRQRTDQIPIDPTVSILAYDDASGLLLAVDASPPATRPLLHKVHRVGRA